MVEKTPYKYPVIPKDAIIDPDIDPSEIAHDYYTHCYNFEDDPTLQFCAIVNRKTGKQHVSLRKLKSATDRQVIDQFDIDCIHTAICSIEDEKEVCKDNIAAKIQSSEGKKEIKMPPEEHFKYLRSWTQGMAENGIKGLTAQHQLEQMAGFQVPLALPLIRFVGKYNDVALDDFLTFIKMECKKDSQPHLPCLISNTNQLLDVLCDDVESNECKKVLDQQFPIDVYKEKPVMLQMPDAAKLPDYKRLFTDKNYMVRYYVAWNPEAVKLPEYKQLFTDKYGNVRYAVAQNQEAVKLPMYKQLFVDQEENVRNAVASNSEAVKLPEYKQLFVDNNHFVRIGIANNPAAVKLPEYKQLFMDKHNMVRYWAARNPEAVKLPEYKQLFTDKNDDVRDTALYNYALYERITKNSKNKQ